jgi:hypothetical protein
VFVVVRTIQSSDASRAGVGSERLKSMHLVLLEVKNSLEATEGVLYGIEARLEVC